jgi:tetratricopeptide (TPR) repeat protein
MIKKQLLLILFICLQFFAFAQRTKGDSLLLNFGSVKDPTEKALTALRIARFYAYSNPALAYEYSGISIAISEKGGNDSVAGDAISFRGTAHYMNGAFDSARYYYQKAISRYQKSGKVLSAATAISNVGLTYINQGSYSDGLKLQFEALAIYDSIRDDRGIGRSYNAIGVVYKLLGDLMNDSTNYNKALFFLRKSLVYSKKVDDRIGYNNILLNIGNVYQNLNRYDSALYYFKEGERLSGAGDDPSTHSSCLGNIAKTYYNMGNYEEAVRYGEQALEEKTQLSDQLGISAVSLLLGQAYQQQGKDQRAFECLLQAYELAQKTGAIVEQSESARELAKNRAAKGEYREAFALLENYTNMKDSISTEEGHKIAMQLQTFSDEDNRKEIELLTQKNLVADLKSKRQSQLLIFSIVSFVLVLILALILYNRFRLKKKANQELQKAYETIEDKNKNITDSILYAKNLQEAILPSAERINHLFTQHFIFYQPKDIVAGDFYWVDESAGITFVAAADCTGHGVPGALVSVVCSKALNDAVFQFRLNEPGAILDKATELVLETFSRRGNNVYDGMDISLASWNPATRELKWSGANNPLVLFNKGEMLVLSPDKQPVGKTNSPKPFTTHTLSVETGAEIFLFTDGYADQFGGEKGKKFMKKNLLDFLKQIATLETNEQREEIEKRFYDWKGDYEQVDDLLVMGLKI